MIGYGDCLCVYTIYCVVDIVHGNIMSRQLGTSLYGQRFKEIIHLLYSYTVKETSSNGYTGFGESTGLTFSSLYNIVHV